MTQSSARIATASSRPGTRGLSASSATPPEARAFLQAIGERRRAYYAFPELTLDMFYPPLYAVSRGLAL
jgi:hypothetical protein